MSSAGSHAVHTVQALICPLPENDALEGGIRQKHAGDNDKVGRHESRHSERQRDRFTRVWSRNKEIRKGSCHSGIAMQTWMQARVDHFLIRLVRSLKSSRKEDRRTLLRFPYTHLLLVTPCLPPSPCSLLVFLEKRLSSFQLVAARKQRQRRRDGDEMLQATRELTLVIPRLRHVDRRLLHRRLAASRTTKEDAKDATRT